MKLWHKQNREQESCRLHTRVEWKGFVSGERNKCIVQKQMHGECKDRAQRHCWQWSDWSATFAAGEQEVEGDEACVKRISETKKKESLLVCPHLKDSIPIYLIASDSHRCHTVNIHDCQHLTDAFQIREQCLCLDQKLLGPWKIMNCKLPFCNLSCPNCLFPVALHPSWLQSTFSRSTRSQIFSELILQ